MADPRNNAAPIGAPSAAPSAPMGAPPPAARPMGAPPSAPMGAPPLAARPSPAPSPDLRRVDIWQKSIGPKENFMRSEYVPHDTSDFFRDEPGTIFYSNGVPSAKWPGLQNVPGGKWDAYGNYVVGGPGGEAGRKLWLNDMRARGYGADADLIEPRPIPKGPFPRASYDPSFQISHINGVPVNQYAAGRASSGAGNYAPGVNHQVQDLIRQHKPVVEEMMGDGRLIPMYPGERYWGDADPHRKATGNWQNPNAINPDTGKVYDRSWDKAPFPGFPVGPGAKPWDPNATVNATRMTPSGAVTQTYGMQAPTMSPTNTPRPGAPRSGAPAPGPSTSLTSPNSASNAPPSMASNLMRNNLQPSYQPPTPPPLSADWSSGLYGGMGGSLGSSLFDQRTRGLGLSAFDPFGTK